MNCSDVQRTLPEVLERGQNVEVETHLKSCPDCSELVADLQLIASEARQLSESEEPAPRLWVRIAAQARAEGIIREPELASARPVPVIGERRRWSVWWLAPVAAALVVGALYFSNHSPAPQVATHNPPAGPSTPSVSASKEVPPFSKAGDQKQVQMAAKRTPKGIERSEAVQHAPMETVSMDDNQFLNRIGRESPDMRATFESQLKTVNAYIKDVEAYLLRNPDDEEARQQLMDAYDQKAMLYQMALDHVQ